jgi:hypothetical protein
MNLTRRKQKPRRRVIPVNKRALVPVDQGGRPWFKPTKKQRELVESMAGYGMPHVDIARLITDDGIDPKTLRLHFRKELDRGASLSDDYAYTNAKEAAQRRAKHGCRRM